MMQRFEIDRRVLECGDQEHGVALVLEEQVFRVPAGALPAQAFGLFDREHRRVRDGRMRDAELVEKGEEVVGRSGHGALSLTIPPTRSGGGWRAKRAGWGLL